MKINYKKLKDSLISLYNQRYKDLNLEFEKKQEKLKNKYQIQDISPTKINDKIKNILDELCCFNEAPKNEEKFTKVEREKHRNNRNKATLERQNGNWFRVTDLRCLARHLYLVAQLINSNIEYANIIKNLCCYLCNGNYFSFDEIKLNMLFDKAFDLYLLDGDKYLSYKDITEDTVIEAIHYFNLEYEKDYTIKDYKILVKENTHKNIHNKIEKAIKEIGGIETLKLIFIHCLNHKYIPEFDRYLICRNKQQFVKEINTPVPFQYLINIASKHIKIKKPKYPNTDKTSLFLETINMSQKYIDLLEIYNPYIFADMNIDYSAIMDYLFENTFLDVLCIPKQYSPKFVIALVEKLYFPLFSETNDLPEFYYSRSFIHIIKRILDYPQCSLISIKELSQNIRVNERCLRKFLNHFSQNSQFINNKFDGILKENNLYKTPLIQVSDDLYFLISPHFCGYSFCEKIYEVLKSNYKIPKGLDRALGENLELLVKDLFIKKDFNYKCGFYEPKKQSLQGECDLIIENKNKILFIEIKNCGLPLEFDSANLVTTLSFLARGMLKAQKQILKHKMYLEKHNNRFELYSNINDTSPTYRLDSNDKRIYSISLCPTEYAFFTVGQIGKLLMESLVFLNFHTEDKEREYELKELNEIADEVKLIVDKYVKIHPDAEHLHEIFFTTSFKSLQQLWIALNLSDCLDDFIDNFIHDTYVSFGSFDYYGNLKHKLDIKNRVK